MNTKQNVASALALLFGIFGSSVLHANLPPPGYEQSSAFEKREFHFNQSRGTQYGIHGRKQPGFFSTLCGNGIGIAAMLPGQIYNRFIASSMNTPSGYPSSWIRRYFGKPVHSQGVTAAGTVIFEEDFLEFPAHQALPVTYRISRANLFIPNVPGAEHRSGLLVMFHRDGKEDLNLFMMPADGLTGSKIAQSPFHYDYTHWLDKPTWLGMLIGWLTFGAASSDFLTQYVQGIGGNYEPGAGPTRFNSPRYTFVSNRARESAFDSNTDPALDWRQRMESMRVTDDDIFTIERFGVGVVGRAIQNTPWTSSHHGDQWIARHTGFIKR